MPGDPQLGFARKLVLHPWMLGLFGVTGFDELPEPPCDEALEGLDENDVHRCVQVLLLHVHAEERPELPDDVLLEYDLKGD